MHHTREEVIERVNREFDLLERLVADLTEGDWARPVPRPETRDPWTVKDALAHITHWKANMARSMRRERRPPEERGLEVNDVNHVVWLRWRDQPAEAVVNWHRQVHQDVLAALREAHDEFFSSKERGAPWPFDLDGHSGRHRVKDLAAALETKPAG